MATKKAATKKKTAKKKTPAKKAAAKKKAPARGARKGGRTANKWKAVKFNQISKFIKEHGVSQIAFAKAVGVTNSTFHNWKNNRCAPDDATQETIRALISGETQMPEQAPSKRGGKPRAPRGAGSQTLAELEKKGSKKASTASTSVKKTKTKTKTKAASSNGNGHGNGHSSGWSELGLLGQFIRANEGRSVEDLHNVVTTVAEAMV